MGGKAWKQHELDYIRDHMETHTAAELAADLERSISSVHYRIREFNGVPKPGSKPAKPKSASWPLKEQK